MDAMTFLPGQGVWIPTVTSTSPLIISLFQAKNKFRARSACGCLENREAAHGCIAVQTSTGSFLPSNGAGGGVGALSSGFSWDPCAVLAGSYADNCQQVAPGRSGALDGRGRAPRFLPLDFPGGPPVDLWCGSTAHAYT